MRRPGGRRASIPGLFRSMARRAVEGLPGKLASRLLPGEPGLAVLLYHRVLPGPETDPWSLSVSTKIFRAQLQLVASRYPVLPLDRALADLDAGKLPSRHAVCITFDDGYRDNAVHAAPILDELGLPATLFLTTGSAASGEPYWWDRVERSRAGAARKGILRPQWASDRVALKAMDPDDRDERILTLGEPEPAFGREDLPMSFAEVRDLAGVFAVGGHGHRHLSLGLAEPGAAARDAAECSKLLDVEIPGHSQLFAYPFGDAEDTAAHAVEAIREAGFTAGFTAALGAVRRGADPWALPRVFVGEESPGSLAYRLLKVFGTAD